MSVLEDAVGYVPANFNMMPKAGAFVDASDFTSSLFLRTRCSVTTGVVSPSGATDAQKLIESSGAGTHFISPNAGPQTACVTPTPMRLAVIAKAAERSRIVLQWLTIEDSNSITSVGFDLAGGNVGYDTVVGSNATLIGYAMTNLGGGWWLCYLDVQYNLTSAPTGNYWFCQINLDAGSGTAARNISYTGNGTSGVDLWWYNMLPKVAWDLKNPTFYDDFQDLSCIDLNDTRAPGFKWYTHNRFPNSFMTTFGWVTNPPSAPTPPANLSISSPSVLKIYNPNSNQTTWTSQLWSVATDGGNGYVGTVHGPPPLLYDGYFNWDGSLAAVNPTWDGAVGAFWGMSIDSLLNVVPPSGRFFEWDVFEGGSNSGPGGSLSAGTALHDWSNPSSPKNVSMGYQLNLPMVLGTFMRLSCIWLPIDAGGWGTFWTFVDGNFRDGSDKAYSATEYPQPATNGSPKIAGQFSEIETMPITMFVNTSDASGAGSGAAFYIDWIRVYTTGTPTPKFRHPKLGSRGGVRQMAA